MPAGKFWGGNYALKVNFGVYLCPRSNSLCLYMPFRSTLGSIYDTRVNFRVYLRPTGQFLGSMCATQVNFWGLSMPYRLSLGDVDAAEILSYGGKKNRFFFQLWGQKSISGEEKKQFSTDTASFNALLKEDRRPIRSTA